MSNSSGILDVQVEDQLIEDEVDDMYDIHPEDGWDENLYDEVQVEEPLMDGHMSPKHSPVHETIDSITLSEYILGNLIVRVASARDLKPIRRSFMSAFKNTTKEKRRGGSITSGGSVSNTSAYVNISFGSSMQRTPTEYDTCHPTWPRSEQYFFDVKLPVPQLALSDSVHNPHSKSKMKSPQEEDLTPPSKPILSFSLFHTDQREKLMKSNNRKSATIHNNDEFLGYASLDVTEIINGKSRCIDKWLPLRDDHEDSALSQGSIRVVVEYEAADVAPRPGDTVRFTGFVDKDDIFPVPGEGQLFRVIDVLGDEVILHYSTKDENWPCYFNAHRFMLISVERYVSALESYREELLDLSTKLINSPALEVISKTVKSIPEEGLVLVGLQAALGGMSIAGRWLNTGINVALDDIVYNLNLDGQHNPRDDDESVSSVDSICDHSTLGVINENDDDMSSISVASGMPLCPISGQKMRDPVVAGDGHTYDRSSISRWLKTSNISPLTGTVMPHKCLVPNYLLISSLQRGEVHSEDGSQITQC